MLTPFEMVTTELSFESFSSLRMSLRHTTAYVIVMKKAKFANEFQKALRDKLHLKFKVYKFDHISYSDLHFKKTHLPFFFFLFLR